MSRGKNLVFFVLFSCVIGAVAWCIGLVNFVDGIPRKVDDKSSKTDGIVILTGGSQRINTAVQLLYEGKAGKLFISGVDKRTKIEDMLIFSGELPDNIGEYLDNMYLGYSAEDTKGNAEETAGWIKKNNVQSIRLVTANYHTPRSILEFHNQIPELKIIAHPVFPKTVILNQWWQQSGTKKLLISEYNKYLISKLRYIIGV